MVKSLLLSVLLIQEFLWLSYEGLLAAAHCSTRKQDVKMIEKVTASSHSSPLHSLYFNSHFKSCPLDSVITPACKLPEFYLQ